MKYPAKKDPGGAVVCLLLVTAFAGFGLFFIVNEGPGGSSIPGGLPWLQPPGHPHHNSGPGAKASANTVAAPSQANPSRPHSERSDHEDATPDFDPMLILDWPGTPEADCRRTDLGTDRETTIYVARFTQHQPLTSFRAAVYEMTESELQHRDPKEWLARHQGGGNVVELTRKPIEHGPQKYLGFEVTARDANLYIRRVNVLAGRRIYTVEVTSIRQGRLNDEDVVEFLDSFTIKDELARQGG